MEQLVGYYESAEFVIVVGISASSTQQFCSRVMMALAIEAGVVQEAGESCPYTRARPDINL